MKVSSRRVRHCDRNYKRSRSYSRLIKRRFMNVSQLRRSSWFIQPSSLGHIMCGRMETMFGISGNLTLKALLCRTMPLLDR